VRNKSIYQVEAFRFGFPIIKTEKDSEPYYTIYRREFDHDNITLLFLILIYITVTLPGRKSDTVTSQGRMPGTRRVVVQFRRLQKRRRRAPYPSLSFHFPRSGTNTSPNSFESRPGFSPLTNYVTTTEQTWLTNMVYAPLI